MARAKVQKSDYLEKVAKLAIPALIFVGGMAVNGFTLAEKVATKPYVDDKFIAAKIYTDEKAANTLKEAFEHSDSNRQAMTIQLEQFKTELISEQSKTTTKVDLVLEAVKNMRQDAWEQVHPKHRSSN